MQIFIQYSFYVAFISLENNLKQDFFFALINLVLTLNIYENHIL